MKDWIITASLILCSIGFWVAGKVFGAIIGVAAAVGFIHYVIKESKEDDRQDNIDLTGRTRSESGDSKSHST